MGLFLDFVQQQWILVSVWAGLILVWYFYEQTKAGKAVGTQGVADLINRENGVVLDVRDGSDYKKGHILGAIHIPQREVAERLQELSGFREKPVIVVCRFGQMSTGVTKTLKAAGFTRVYKLAGGMIEWEGANLPLVTK